MKQFGMTKKAPFEKELFPALIIGDAEDMKEKVSKQDLLRHMILH